MTLAGGRGPLGTCGVTTTASHPNWGKNFANAPGRIEPIVGRGA